MARIVAFLYGVACYLVFLGTFLYAIGFVSNVFVPKSIDSAPRAPLGTALLVNVLLLGLFAVQHSGMARQSFKRAWTRIVPAPIERSTYVLCSSLVLLLLFWKWEPMGALVWDVHNERARLVLIAVSVAGWLTVLLTTFLIDHFDLFGLRQVFLYLRGRDYRPVGFRTPAFYTYVRHPLYLGFVAAFWGAPTMSAAHLVFALATTAYILVAIQLEERDLLRFHGDTYGAYRRQVSMLLPMPPRRPGARAARPRGR